MAAGRFVEIPALHQTGTTSMTRDDPRFTEVHRD